MNLETCFAGDAQEVIENCSPGELVLNLPPKKENHASLLQAANKLLAEVQSEIRPSESSDVEDIIPPISNLSILLDLGKFGKAVINGNVNENNIPLIKNFAALVSLFEKNISNHRQKEALDLILEIANVIDNEELSIIAQTLRQEYFEKGILM